MRRTILACVLVALAVGGGSALAASSLLVTSSHQIKNHVIRGSDLHNNAVGLKQLSPRVRSLLRQHGASGQNGSNGTNGSNGVNGTNGTDAETKITSFSGDFSASNPSVTMTGDGVQFGPYADGGADGGSVIYAGLNGSPLSAINSLIYSARYQSDGDTGGVGVPYLRVFLNGNNDDIVFSPNTQPPDSDTAEGPFHTWAATSGLWRYDDDGGSGGQYGLNGASFMQVLADHGSEPISKIVVSDGFSAGTNLEGLLRSLKVNSTTFAFGS